MKNPLADARRRYQHHRTEAINKRGIPFELTFAEWYLWWMSVGVNKNTPQVHGRGTSVQNHREQLCMCRLGDSGPYSLANIYPGTRGQNSTLRNQLQANRTGRRVRTPLGDFDSISQAARAAGVKYHAIVRRIRRQPQDYQYI